MPITDATKLEKFGGFLTPDEAKPIFDEAAKQSVFQRLIPRIPLGANGEKIPVTTERPTANWVGEGERKPTTEMGLGLIHVEPKKLAAIAVMSAEVVRANPGGYATKLRTELASAFATAFDLAVAHNVGGDGTGTGPFKHHLAETTKAVQLGSTAQGAGGVHGDFAAALSLMLKDKKQLTGWALDNKVEPDIWSAVDANGRPLYTELPTDDVSQTLARPGKLLNRPSFMGEGVAHGSVLGFGGNFQKAAWGAVGGISFRVSDTAAVTIGAELKSLWEHNLVAVLAEAEYGFAMEDPAHFVKITEAPAGP